MDAAGGAPGFDYLALLRTAVLHVIREVMARTAEQGLPGDHHFYLTFATTHEGVELSARLRRQHPEEMTIVLQHQFSGLKVDETGFAVALRFSGAPERLFVPWTALRSFADPSVGFGLSLQPEHEATSPDARAMAADQPSSARPASESPAQRGNVVALDAFRRKAED